MFNVYEENKDQRGGVTYTKLGEFRTRREANSVRPPARARVTQPRRLLYRGDQFINSTGW